MAVEACHVCGMQAATVLHTNGHVTCAECKSYVTEERARETRARRKHARTAVPTNQIIRDLVELRDELA